MSPFNGVHLSRRSLDGTANAGQRGDGVARLLVRNSLTSTTALLAYLGLADFVVHMLFAGNYGYFRDELYYIVSGTQHLSLGYVDFPPLIAWIAALLGAISKDSLVSIHVLPAFVESALVVLSGLIARELGGGRRAQLLAGVSTCLTLVFLADGSLFTPDFLDQFWWSLLAYFAIRTVRRKEPRTWFYAGIVIGVGILTKADMLFFAFALLVSFLAVPSSRKYLRSKWVAAGALVAFALALPILYWNLANGWPMLQFYLEFRGDVSGGGPVVFFFSQVEEITFLNIPIFLMGLYFYLRSDAGRELRFLGLSYLILYAAMTLADMKPYYLLPIYPMLFAAGAIIIERSSASRKGVSRWFGSRPYLAVLAILALLLVPLTIPIFPPSILQTTYGSSTLSSSNGVASAETGPLPQTLGDRLGWETMVATLARVYANLTTSQKSQACIFTTDYGQASAVNFIGRSLGLPAAISGHNNYYIWGPGSCTGEVLITVGPSLSYFNGSFTDFEKNYVNTTLRQGFASVTYLTTITCEYCMNNENNVPVYLCTNPTFTSIESIWAGVRHYD